MASASVVNPFDQRTNRSSIEGDHEMPVMSSAVITMPLLSAVSGVFERGKRRKS
jgi:hypothetical protein